MDAVRTYTVNRKIVRKDGTIRIRQEQQTYTPKRVQPVITQQVRDEIKRQHQLGVPNKVLSSRFGVSLYMLRQILAYQPTNEQLRQFAREDATAATEVPLEL